MRWGINTEPKPEIAAMTAGTPVSRAIGTVPGGLSLQMTKLNEPDVSRRDQRLYGQQGWCRTKSLWYRPKCLCLFTR